MRGFTFKIDGIHIEKETAFNLKGRNQPLKRQNFTHKLLHAIIDTQ